MRSLSPVLLLLAAIQSLSGADSWPQFRGPRGDGHAPAASVPIKFSEQESVLWKTELPGKAWSSPIIVDNLIWLTTAIELKPTEEEFERMLAEQIEEAEVRKSRNVAKAVELKLISVDLTTGSIVSTIDLTTIEQPDVIHSLNSYASPTPMIDGDQVICHFGAYGTFCVDRQTGEMIWQRRFPIVHSVGPGSSPLVYDNLVILIHDGCDRQYVTALDKQTGETVWEVDRPELEGVDGQSKKSFCTPIAVTDKLGREQFICMGAQWIIAYDPKTGKEIWKCKHGTGFSVVPRPVCDGSAVYFATGYAKPSLLAVGIDGQGDVSDTHVRWKVDKGIPAKPSPILCEGLIYVIDDTGIASCIEASSGAILWRERIGGNYSASPILVGGHIYFGSQEGKVTVIQPGREYKRVAENQIDDRIMASPAVADDSIVLRTENALYRIGAQ